MAKRDKERSHLKRRVLDIDDLLPKNYIEYMLKLEPRWDTPKKVMQIHNVRSGRSSNEAIVLGLEEVAREYQAMMKRLEEKEMFPADLFESAEKETEHPVIPAVQPAKGRRAAA